MKIEQIQAIIQDNGICSLVDRSDKSVVQSWFRQVSIFKSGDDQISRTGCLPQRGQMVPKSTWNWKLSYNASRVCSKTDITKNPRCYVSSLYSKGT